MRKKWVGVILIIGLCLAAAGCGSSADGTGAEAAEEPEEDTAETAEEFAEAEAEAEAETEPEIEAEEGEETAEMAAEPEDESGTWTGTEEETAEAAEEFAEAEAEAEAEPEEAESALPGASLNGTQFAEGDDPQRVTYEDGFYYEPISDALLDYITGSSYPEPAGGESVEISPYDLRYVHVLYCDFDGQPAEGELICNAAIAQDLVEIFCELYKNEYQIEQIHLVDEYGGDDDASMAANNTSCFNYRNVANSGSLSKHALGRAVDINPLYNPYITYNSDGSTNCSPAEGWAYADRSADFAHKIDTNDLCYQLFAAHGFTWGGSWNSSKDYQHFQKE